MASMYHVQMAPHHEPHLHGHLLGSEPNGLILESFSNPVRDPYWPALYARVPQIVDGRMTLLEEPGLGVVYDADFIRRHGTVLA